MIRAAMNAQSKSADTSCNPSNREMPVQERRRLLGAMAAGLTGLLIAPGVHLMEIARAAQSEPESSIVPGTVPAASAGAGANAKVRWGMLIDTTQCSPDCNACVDACRTENALPIPAEPTDSQWIRKIEIREVKTGRTHSLPMMCQHCAEPPCVDVCPTGASFKRADGIVLVDKHICIGCRYCLMACPYKARSFVHEPQSHQKTDVPRGMGTAEGCTLCVHRIDRGDSPACVTACAATGRSAMVFGDLNDPGSEISKRLARYATRQLREDLQLGTGVRYQGV